jgi:hypothetical protein
MSSIVELTKGVAPQNFFDLTCCTFLFNEGIVSISLLPSSTKMMANGSLRASSPVVAGTYSDIDECHGFDDMPWSKFERR